MTTEIGRRPRRKSFAEQSLGDMMRSVFVLLLVIGAIYGLRALVTDSPERPVRAVDYTGQLASARDLAGYPVLAPQGLGPGWVPTSVDLKSSSGTVRWHLGFLTPAKQYVGLEQGDFEPQALLDTYVGDLQEAGRLDVAGEPWRLYRGETDTGLVRRGGREVTIVVGTAGIDEIRRFAQSLG